MSSNPTKDRLEQELIQTIAQLKKDFAEMRLNQTNVLKYGNITLDGNNNKISIADLFGREISVIDSSGYKIKDLSGNEIIRLDATGMTIIQNAGSSAYTEYVKFKKGIDSVGMISHVRYTPSDVVTDLRIRSIQPTDNNRNTYLSLEVDLNDTTRDLFFQMSNQYVSGAFASASLTFRKEYALGKNTFEVDMSDINGDGVMRIPERADDSTGAYGGPLIYWNRTAGKFRGRSPSGNVYDLN